MRYYDKNTHTQAKHKYYIYMILPYEVPGSGEFIATGRTEVTLGLEGGKTRESCLMATELLFGVMGRFWKWMVVTVVQLWECSYCH